MASTEGGKPSALTSNLRPPDPNSFNLPRVPSQNGIVPLELEARTGNLGRRFLTEDRTYGVTTLEPLSAHETPQIPVDVFEKMRNAALRLGWVTAIRETVDKEELSAKKQLEDLLAEYPELGTIQILSLNLEAGGPYRRSDTVTDPDMYEAETPQVVKASSVRRAKFEVLIPFSQNDEEEIEMTNRRIREKWKDFLRTLGFSPEEIQMLERQGQIKEAIVIKPPEYFKKEVRAGAVAGAEQYMQVKTGRRNIDAGRINEFQIDESEEES